MVIDLTTLLSGECDKIGIDYTFPLDFASDGLPDSLYHVSFTSPAHVVGEVVDNAGYMRMTLSVSCDYTGECARCLAPVNGTLSFDFERTVTTEGMLQKGGDDGDYEDEYVVAENGMVNVDPMLLESVLLEFPLRLLCGEDCKGLCPKCGKDLNLADCGCPKKVTDPRWDVLKNINFDK